VVFLRSAPYAPADLARIADGNAFPNPWARQLPSSVAAVDCTGIGAQACDTRASYRDARSIPKSPEHPDKTYLDVISVGESAVTYECRGDGGEGEEVFRLALVAAVQASAAGQPGHGPLHDPAVPAQVLG
jgi:hypothetical protein